MSGVILVAATLALGAPDTVVAVDADVQVDVVNRAGTVRVTTWDRAAVEVLVRPAGAVRVEVSDGGDRVVVRPRWTGAPGDVTTGEAVDIELRTPRQAALDIRGVETTVFIEGAESDVAVETVAGSVSVRGGDGRVVLQSIEDDVYLADAAGRIEVRSASGNLRLERINGEVRAETIDGDVTMDDTHSIAVDARTVDGDLTFAGSIDETGRYRLRTHDGDITLFVPDATNATVSVSSFAGDFESDFPVVLRDSRSRRFNFSVGDGGAQVTLESFEGNVVLRRRG